MPIQGVIPDERHITEEATQCLVEDPQDIFNILLQQNYRALLKSNESVFTTGDLAEKLEDEGG